MIEFIYKGNNALQAVIALAGTPYSIKEREKHYHILASPDKLLNEISFLRMYEVAL